jgi:hypothetical protein
MEVLRIATKPLIHSSNNLEMVYWPKHRVFDVGLSWHHESTRKSKFFFSGLPFSCSDKCRRKSSKTNILVGSNRAPGRLFQTFFAQMFHQISCDLSWFVNANNVFKDRLVLSQLGKISCGNLWPSWVKNKYRRYTLRFITCSSSFNLFSNFTLNFVFSRHIKIQRYVVCISCMLKILSSLNFSWKSTRIFIP